MSAASPFFTPEMLASQGRMLPPGIDFDLYRKIILFSGIILAVFGLAAIVLGIFVLKASRGAIITSIVLMILAILLQLVNMVGQFAAGGTQAVGGLLNLFIAGILTWLVVWLFQANSAAGQLRAAEAMQYYQQYPQGYGYPPAQQQWPHQPQWGAPPQQQQPPPQQQQQQWPPPPANPPSS
jgi:hypothetical protein